MFFCLMIIYQQIKTSKTMSNIFDFYRILTDADISTNIDWLSKSTIDFMRYLIMYNDHHIYKFFIDQFEKKSGCDILTYSVPIIKKDGQIGTVDYGQIFELVLKNYEEFVNYVKLECGTVEQYNDYVTKYNLGIVSNNQQYKKKLSDLGVVITDRGFSYGYNIADSVTEITNDYQTKMNSMSESMQKCEQDIQSIGTTGASASQFIKLVQIVFPDIKEYFKEKNINIDEFDPSDEIGLITMLSDVIKYKKEKICKNIKNCTNIFMIIKVNLHFINIDAFGTIKFSDSGHANSVVIRKNGSKYMAIRTEPHRHSNIYCRNSVRQEIRSIFDSVDQITYVDYIIKTDTKLGLQGDEANDFDTLSSEYKIQSPLQGNSGFCVSWTLYTTLLLLLNPSTSIDKLGEYMGNLNIVQTTHTLREILDKAETIDSDDIIGKTMLLEQIKQLVKSSNGHKYLDAQYSHQSDPNYVLQKHKNLYVMLIVCTYILVKHVDKYEGSICDDYFIKNKKIMDVVRENPNDVDKDNTTIDILFGKIEQKFSDIILIIQSYNTSDRTNIDTTYVDVHKEGDKQTDTCSVVNIGKYNKKTVFEAEMLYEAFVKKMAELGIGQEEWDGRVKFPAPIEQKGGEVGICYYCKYLKYKYKNTLK